MNLFATIFVLIFWKHTHMYIYILLETQNTKAKSLSLFIVQSHHWATWNTTPTLFLQWTTPASGGNAPLWSILWFQEMIAIRSGCWHTNWEIWVGSLITQPWLKPMGRDMWFARFICLELPSTTKDWNVRIDWAGCQLSRTGLLITTINRYGPSTSQQKRHFDHFCIDKTMGTGVKRSIAAKRLYFWRARSRKQTIWSIFIRVIRMWNKRDL